MQTCQVADARPARESTRRAPGPLPVEQAQFAGRIPDQDVLGIQVSMEEAGLVQPGESGTTPRCQLAAAAVAASATPAVGSCSAAVNERGSRLHLLDKQERPPPGVLSRGCSRAAGRAVTRRVPAASKTASALRAPTATPSQIPTGSSQ